MRIRWGLGRVVVEGLWVDRPYDRMAVFANLFLSEEHFATIGKPTIPTKPSSYRSVLDPSSFTTMACSLL